MDIDQLVESELDSINKKTESLMTISSLIMSVTSIPASILLSFRDLIDQIKNDDINSAISSLESSIIQIDELTHVLIESLQILKQEK